MTDFAAIVDTAVSPFVLIDDVGTVTWAGSSITELTGWTPESLVGRNMLDFLDEPSQVAVIDSFSRFADTAASGPDWLGTGLLVGVRSPSGATVACIVSSATSARTGVPGMVVQLVRATAVTHLHSAVRAMATGRELDEVLNRLADMVAGEIAGASVEIAWGWDGSAFAGVSGSEIGLIGRDDGSAGERPWATAMATGAATTHADVTTLPPAILESARAFGVTGCWVQPISVLPGEAPSAAVVVWRRREVDATSFTTQYVERGVDLVALALQWSQGRQSLEREARHDVLTGLANRRAFLERLRRSAPPDSPGTVLFCDLDRFKPVNDRHGHTVGDNVLVVIGERLQRAVRPTDLVARYGGDEFVVFCPALVDQEEIAGLTRRLQDAIAQPINVDGITVEVGITVGTAPLPAGADADQVMANAATDMGRAKRSGRA